jgi:hypothetical protein
MYPLIHAAVSLLFSAVLYPLFGINVVWIFLFGVFIDVDHYLIYVANSKDISLRKSYRFYDSIMKEKKFDKTNNDLFIFHTVEFMFLIFLLSNISEVFLFMAAGIVIHLLMDWLYDIFILKKEFKSTSLIFWMINNSRKTI